MEQDFANATLTKEAKRIDKWIAYVATHAWARSLVFIAAFLEGTISPLPPELAVAAVLSYRKDISWKMLSVISATGSAVGLSVLYLLGKYAYKTHGAFFKLILGSTPLGAYTESLFSHNTFVSMFFSTFTPLLDRVFAVLSGVFSLSLVVVFVAFFLGRLIRVGIVAYFSQAFGQDARRYILKHTRIAAIVVMLLLAIYIGLKYYAIL